jgi:hypothetical protein
VAAGDVSQAVAGHQERAAGKDPELDYATASSDTMMAVDLPSGMCGLIARCCGQPAPYIVWDDHHPAPGSVRGSVSTDVTCGTCGSTLAVIRWRQ